MPRPALEVALEQHKAMRDIERCRTAGLGGHVDSCSQGCGYLAISYNSCRNRHCPKCQSLKQARWLAERLERLLPAHYFHLVVTLPHELNPLTLYNPELVFNLLFESVSRALQQFARDYERLRAQVGFTAVLHTWDQDLNLHPHLHLVVTGGGLSADGDRWIAARNSFLLPVRALSKIIRGKFLDGLQQAYQEGRLEGQVQCLEDPVQFRRFTRKLRRKKWVVYAKGTFDASQNAYHYLSRYTHRVAIANHRLVSLAEGKVSFRARDNSRPGHQRLVTIAARSSSAGFSCTFCPRALSKYDTTASWPPAMPKPNWSRREFSSASNNRQPIRNPKAKSLTLRARPKLGRRCCGRSPVWISPLVRTAPRAS